MDARLVEIVDELLSIVQSLPQDVNWQSWYDSEQGPAEDLLDHAERVHRGDDSRLPELKFLLVVTGPLCEIAMSSGWAEDYVRLANEFDGLYPGPIIPLPPGL
jgi:hypothetical protein